MIKVKNVREGTKDFAACEEVITHDCYKLSEWKPKRYPKFIVDVGCQIGAFSLLASHIYPECSILAFEMMEENHQIALLNLKDQKNVKCFHGAVVGKNRPIGFRYNENNTGGHKTVYEGKDSYLGSSRFKADYESKSNLPSFNFPKIFSENNIDRIDLLKLDCEGSEYEIIPHLIETDLIKKVDNISIELHGRDQKEYKITLDFLSKSFESSIVSQAGHLANFRNLCI